MSVILTLTSAAIIAGVSMATVTSTAVISQISDGTFDVTEGIETMFADEQVLVQTLDGYDCHYDVISENEYLVITNCGNIRYFRENANMPFKMYLDEIENVEGLLENIKSFEEEYCRNVQAYTYGHIKKNLSANMSIADEEILEDNSVLLTINVD